MSGTITWQMEWIMVGKALLAALLGGAIGWERIYRNKIDSEIRTFAAVSLGACIFGLVSIMAAGDKYDPARIASNVVQGIGFLGAGIILRDQGRVRGMATAATLWSSAAVGLAVAFDLFTLALIGAFSIFLVRHVPDWRHIDSTYQDGTDPANPAKYGEPSS